MVISALVNLHVFNAFNLVDKFKTVKGLVSIGFDKIDHALTKSQFQPKNSMCFHKPQALSACLMHPSHIGTASPSSRARPA